MPAPHFKPKTIPKSEFWKNKKTKNKKRDNKKNKWKKNLFIFVLILILLGFLSIFLALIWLSRDLPSPDQLIEREIAQTTTIYDRSGEHILYEIHGEEKRTLIDLEDIPSYVKQATISIEDKNFYNHRGFSVWAIFRTVVNNILRGEKAGGSTLTQQFIKNAILGPEKKYSRKIKELVLAQRLEKKFEKDEILQMYLNEIPYGSNAYGVMAASQKYFGKNVQDINLAEAALLAALPQAPSLYSPYGPNKELLLGRKDYILKIMKEQGYITEQEMVAAQSYDIKFKGPKTDINAPHFVMYVKGLLSEKYGEKTIEQEGFKIYTTIDWDLQLKAEEIIKEKLNEYGDKYEASNASLVTIDPKNGQILTMVGSRDFFNNDIDGQVNIALSNRQPGSSLKPLVYASLFELGYTPNTILYDVETNFSTNPAEPYVPKNYNGQEAGPINIRKSLAGSLNIPAVKSIYLADIKRVLDLADNMDYSTFSDRSRFGLSLVLGGGEVKLLEHVNAYSAFAREGLLNKSSAILRIEDKNGKILEEYKQEEKKVLTNKSARMINSILSDNEARSLNFGLNSWLNIEDRQVAAKTGTTNNYRDAWTIGYTPSLVVGVWVGNSNNDEMKSGASGGVIAAPIWNEFIKYALKDHPKETFRELDDIETGKDILDGNIEITKKSVLIDSISGLLATEHTPKELIEEIEVFDHHSILHYINKEDPLGPAPDSPEIDPQYLIWEEAINKWAEEDEEFSNFIAPSEEDDLHLPENTPFLEILTPSKNLNINNNELIVSIEAEAKRDVYKTEYFLNNVLWERVDSLNPVLIKNIDFLKNGAHKLTVKVCDDVFNCKSKDIIFNLQLPEEKEVLSSYANIIYPNSGLSLNEIDFPLLMRIKIENPSFASYLQLFIEKEGDEKKLLTEVFINNKEEISINLEEKPVSGNYYISGKLFNWDNTVKDITPIFLIIN